MAGTFRAISIIMGTIIGAGIFAIPYVIMKVGLTIGLIQILLIALIMSTTFLYLGEIALRTKADHQLPGYAEKYLGKKGKVLMFISLLYGINTAILAYLIGVGNSFSVLIFNNQDYVLHFGFIFWIFMSILSYIGLKALKEGEFIGVSTAIIFILSLAAFSLDKINTNNIFLHNSPNILSYFAPFGVILFAFLGYSIVPEIKRVLKNNKNKMKRTILIAISSCAIIYIIFSLIVVGTEGQNTPKIATIALGKPFIFLGIITMFNAYFALSVALIDIFQLDFKLSKIKSWLITAIIPMSIFTILSLTNNADFTKILGLGGIISGTLSSILILSMIDKAKILGDRHPEYSMPTSRIVKYLLISIFILGAITGLINFFSSL
ncbi:MAG: aromatic amino acid transport family protein [Nanoarchaeota archaeon]|nr:aromatic amino acid transport family protein [Nanoarchaeota archaeon]